MTIHYVFQSYVTQEQKALCQAYFEHVINPKEDSAKAIAKLCSDHEASPESLSRLLLDVRVYDSAIQCRGCGKYYEVTPPYYHRPNTDAGYYCRSCEVFINAPF